MHPYLDPSMDENEPPDSGLSWHESVAQALGAFLRLKRAQRSMRASYAAWRLDMTPQNLHRLENGTADSIPTLETLVRCSVTYSFAVSEALKVIDSIEQPLPRRRIYDDC
jgi:transcriptional regulator with XRE-family HTH domain